jgi:hypothetical protein
LLVRLRGGYTEALFAHLTYHVQKEFPCNHRANELTKFIKKFEKIIDVLLILLHLYIKF